MGWWGHLADLLDRRWDEIHADDVAPLMVIVANDPSGAAPGLEDGAANRQPTQGVFANFPG